MNTNNIIESEVTSDADLVESSLAGDRDAFGHIVARYQSSICALAYSACGNVGRSEDLAQEVFITAWRKLESLQERGKFKAWLFGIARNLIHNSFRRATRNPLSGAEMLDEQMEPATASEEPDERAITKEEETILWHILSGMPQIYREPMVLFYRQNESTPRVAEVLEISEEAVRQRLARGRMILNERVTKVIQSGLRRSGPKDAFVATVIASLPLLAASTTAKGAVVGLAAAEGAKGQTAGLVAMFKGIGVFAGILAIPATLGACFGLKMNKDAAGLPQQRESVKKFWRVLGIGTSLFVFLPLLLLFAVFAIVPLHGEARAMFLKLMTCWLGLAYPLVVSSVLFWAWQRTRKSSGPGEAERRIESGSLTGHRKISRRPILYVTLAAAALLIFCLTDTAYNVQHPSPGELQEVIRKTPAGELRVSINEGHPHSLFHYYPEINRTLWVEVRHDGKTTRYDIPADDATLAVAAQKGIPCPTYVQGRDYEVLGTPGRLLPLLVVFVLGIGIISLFRRHPQPAAAK